MQRLGGERRAVLPQRGSEGMAAWLLHRATGLLLAGYLVVHLVVLRSLVAGPVAFEHWMRLLRGPAARAALSLVLAAVIWHGVSGLRLMWLGTAPETARHRTAFRLAAGLAGVIWLLSMAMLWGALRR